MQILDILSIFAFQHPLLYGAAFFGFGFLGGGAFVANWLGK